MKKNLNFVGGGEGLVSKKFGQFIFGFNAE